MSTYNEQIQECIQLHRRVANLLDDSQELRKRLDKSEEERQTLAQELQAEKSIPRCSPNCRAGDKRLVTSHRAICEEVDSLRRELVGAKAQVRLQRLKAQKLHEENDKLSRENMQLSQQRDELSHVHQHETEALKQDLQHLRNEAGTLRQSLSEAEERRELYNDQVAKIAGMEGEIHALRRTNETLRRQDPPRPTPSIPTRSNEVLPNDASEFRLPNQPRSLPKNEPLDNLGGSLGIDSEEWILETTSRHSTVISTRVISLPPRLAQPLATIPTVVDVPDDHNMVLFSRQFLADTLGGGIQSLITNIGESIKPLAVEFGTRCYLCPNRDQNIWCPTKPGQHGYMFVGLGREADTFHTTETRHIFVNTGADVGNKKYKYIGMYEALRIDGLTPEEWRGTSDDFKNKYCITTYKKTTPINNQSPIKQSAKAKQFRAQYDSGKLRVPCVQLRCIYFDEDFYAALVKASNGNDRSVSSSPTKSYGKRTNNDDTYSSPRKKATRTSL